MKSKIIFFLLCTLSAFGQRSLIHISGDSLKKVEIQELEIKSTVFGNSAVTELTATIYNPFDSQLSGEINFPLNDGDFVYGYALDINGTLREAVAVEKSKAREVFESIVSRGVDPGLVEKTQGNVFKTRIYPIPAKGTRTFKLEIFHQFTSNHSYYEFKIPFSFTEKIQKSKTTIDVYGYEKKNIINKSNFKVEKKSNYYKYTTLANSKDLILKLKKEENSTAFYQQKNETYYYSINSVIKLNKKHNNNYNKICVLWDVSRSRKNADLKKEINFLKYLLKKTSFTEVQLIAFNNQIQVNKTFTKIDDLLKTIEKLDYDGGTQYGNLKNEISSSDMVLLFSDGMSNFGSENIEEIESKLFTVSASKITDFTKMKSIALANKGLYINLNESKNSNAAKLILSTRTTLNETKTWIDSYPKQNYSFNSNELNIIGKSKNLLNEISINISNPNQKIDFKKFIKIPKKIVDLEKIFALKQLDDLSLDAKANEKQIVEISKKYNLVSDFTSLLVLEDIYDYIKNEIYPPTKDLQELYDRNIEIIKIEKQIDLLDYENKALSYLKEHLEWSMKDGKNEILVADFKKLYTKNDDTIKLLKNKIREQEDELKEKGADYTFSSRNDDFMNQPIPVLIFIQKTELENGKVSIKGNIKTNDEDSSYLLNDLIVEDYNNRQNMTALDSNLNFDIIVDSTQYYKIVFSSHMISNELISIYQSNVIRTEFNIKEQDLQEIVVMPYVPSTKQNLNIEELTKNSINDENYNIHLKDDNLYVIRRGFNQRLGKNPLVYFDLEPDNFNYLTKERLQEDFEDNDLSTFKSKENKFEWEDVFSLEILSPEKSVELYGKHAKDGIIFVYTNKFIQDENINLPANVSKFINQNLSVKKWSSNPEYIKILEKTSDENLYDKYLELAKTYGNGYAFYLITSDFFKNKKQPEAETILSNIAEIDLNNSANMRTLAYKLRSIGKPELAVPLFEKIFEYRPDEPISYRDLGISYILSGEKDKGLEVIKRGINLEWVPLLEDPDDYLETINTYFNDYKGFGGKDDLYNFQTEKETYDLRFVLTWTSNDCDIDLHLVAPSKEQFSYSSTNNENIKFNTDVTTGYGPEEILIRNAEKGDYQVLIDFYADSSQIIRGPVALTLEVYKNFGRPNQERIEKVFYLTEAKDNLTAGIFRWE